MDEEVVGFTLSNANKCESRHARQTEGWIYKNFNIKNKLKK